MRGTSWNAFVLLGVAAAAAGALLVLADGSRRGEARASERRAAEHGGGRGADEVAARGGEDEGDGEARPRGRRAVELEPVAEAEEADGFDEAALYGTVVGPRGEPIAGALAIAIADGPGEEDARELARATADEGGRFRIRELEPHAEHDVVFAAEGWRTKRSTLYTGADEEVRLEPALPLAGRVLDARTRVPVEGARVATSALAWRGDALEREFACETDAEGRFELENVADEGEVGIAVTRPGSAPHETRVQVRAGVRDGYEILVPEARRFVLELVELETGRRLPDLDVELFGSRVPRRTDAAGRIELDVPRAGDAGELALLVRAGGWCTTRLTVSPEELEARYVRVPLHRGARVAGRVVLASGAPAEGARVLVWSRGRRNAPPGPALPDGVRITDGSTRPRADGEGRFEATGVVPSEEHAFTVHAHLPGFAPAELEDVRLAVSGAALDALLVLEVGGVVEGVVTRGGEPVSALVHWRGDPSGFGQTRANDRGSFRLAGVAPGEVRVSAHDRSHFSMLGGSRETAVERVLVRPGEVHRVDFALEESAGTISGRLVDAGGEPVAGARVSAWARDEHTREMHSASDTTGPEGAFEIELPPTRLLFSVYASDRGLAAREEGVAAGTSGLELVLPRAASVLLRVVDAATREPLPRFEVLRSSAAGEDRSQHGTPGAGGLYELTLPEGRSDLLVSARELGFPPVEVPGVAADPDAEPRVLEVALERGCDLELVVTGEQEGNGGAPLLVTEDQERDLDGAGGRFTQRHWTLFRTQRVRLAPSGQVVLRGLAPGTYRWWSLPDAVEVEPAEIEVPRREAHRVEVTWRRAEEPEVADGGGGG